MLSPVVPNRARRAALLAEPALLTALTRFVRARVPGDEADDVVQSTIEGALAAHEAPADDHELKLWVYGIARNKVADFFRRSRREVPREPNDADDEAAPAESAPASARDLLKWAEKELPEGEGAERTLEWMLREGQGEKLESIAADANVPAPRVRQRVARLRRHFRARWAAQLAAAAALLAIVMALIAFWKSRDEKVVAPAPLAPSPTAPLAPQSPLDRAKEIRRVALHECGRNEWQPCVDGLDSAKALDAAGDAAEAVQKARREAAKALSPAPTPPAPSPSSSVFAPTPAPTDPSPLPPTPTPKTTSFGSTPGPGSTSESSTPTAPPRAPSTATTPAYAAPTSMTKSQVMGK